MPQHGDDYGMLTVTEAGRRGGQRTLDRYGQAYYSEIGKKGGATTAAQRGPAFYAEIGRAGGLANRERYGPEHYARIGKQGGATTKAKYGPEHYREMGRAGGRATGSRPRRGAGAGDGRARLTEAQVREIRQRRADDGTSYAALSAAYRVSIRTVWLVVHRRTWRAVA